jgi:hypothetical protein
MAGLGVTVKGTLDEGVPTTSDTLPMAAVMERGGLVGLGQTTVLPTILPCVTADPGQVHEYCKLGGRMLGVKVTLMEVRRLAPD